ncbi:hypothetical protein [Promicromonospora sp. NPDC090134]|uniref:hypothetical protein n=1 Tax=Promicromonospora sp. NPDC090134 TaxID=3364408 RepID=UPI0037FEE0C7
MITTLVVDDTGSVRRSLQLLLETTDDIRVAGEASNGVDAVHLARALRPDVVTSTSTARSSAASSATC